MRRLIGAIVLVAWAVALAAPAVADDAQIAKGKEVYAAQKCKMCHSIAGEGNKKGALDEVGSKYSVEDLKAWIVDAKGMQEKAKSERKPAMKNYELPAADLEALVAYIASLKKAQ
jgi:mono/diheme cytochrome c family protein